MNRRAFVGGGATALAAFVTRCGPGRRGHTGGGELQAMRLLAKPGRPSTEPPTAGVHPLKLGGVRDGVMLVPSGYRPAGPVPLVLVLHGSGDSSAPELRRLQALADERDVLLLAVDSRDRTWDVILHGYGPDVAFIDRALAHVFARVAVDPARVALEGFSDGASYALGLGLSNGDLFTHVLAFSPGFLPPVERQAAPGVFISHGTEDPILPIEQCSRRIVPELRELGYRIRYLEFAGGHSVPEPVAREGFGWFLGG